jgi:threonine synthase
VIGCTHLECTATGERLESETLRNLSPAGAPLYPRYDLAAIAASWSPADLTGREPNLWRYREVLPVRDDAFRLSLGEGMTPLIRAERIGGDLEVFVKDESQNPTASFKARGLAVAISRAVELGARAVALPSAGNAGSATAAYAALAGIEAHIVMPRDTPPAIVTEARALGGHVELLDGLISDCGAVVKRGCAERGWFDLSTLKEPYRVEGKKTLGYEVAEQLGWELPDAIVYPTGGGTGLVGMWKAFDELEALGWIGAKRPKMISVQSTGCAPIVRAFDAGDERAEPWQGARTTAYGLRVPVAVGDFLILSALRASGGAAIAVSDEQMRAAVAELGAAVGIFASPEGGATLAALPVLRERGVLAAGDRVVLFNTGSGLKYL